MKRFIEILTLSDAIWSLYYVFAIFPIMGMFLFMKVRYLNGLILLGGAIFYYLVRAILRLIYKKKYGQLEYEEKKNTLELNSSWSKLRKIIAGIWVGIFIIVMSLLIDNNFWSENRLLFLGLMASMLVVYSLIFTIWDVRKVVAILNRYEKNGIEIIDEL